MSYPSYVEWFARHGGLSAGYSMAHHAERKLARIDRGALGRLSPDEAYAKLERLFHGPLLNEALRRWWRARS